MTKPNKRQKKVHTETTEELIEQITKHKISGYEAPSMCGKSTHQIIELAKSNLKMMVLQPNSIVLENIVQYIHKLSGIEICVDFYDYEKTNLCYVTPKTLYNIINHEWLKNGNLSICDLIIIDEIFTTLEYEHIYRMINYMHKNEIACPKILFMSSVLPDKISVFEDFPIYRNVEFESNKFSLNYKYLDCDIKLLSKDLLITLSSIVKNDIRRINEGVILVLLPSGDEINHFIDCFKPQSVQNLEIIQIHSHSSKSEISKLNKPIKKGFRRIILSTKILGTSAITTDLSVIYDSMVKKGYQRSETDGIKSVSQIITKNDARLRAYRGGRTCNTTVIRMCTEDFYNCLPETQNSDIQDLPVFRNILTSISLNIHPLDLYKDSINYNTYIDIIVNLYELEMIELKVEKHFKLNKKMMSFEDDLMDEAFLEDFDPRSPRTLYASKISSPRNTSSVEEIKTLTVTEIGEFALQCDLSIRFCHVLYKWIKSGQDVFVGIVLTSIIENLGGGSYLYFPDKRRDQTITEYNSFKETWTLDHFDMYNSNNDLQFLFKVFRRLFDSVCNFNENTYDFDYVKVIEYTHKNSLNSKKIIECLRTITQLCEKFEIKITQLPTGSEEIIETMIRIISVVYSNSVYKKVGYKFTNGYTECSHFKQLCKKEPEDNIIAIIMIKNKSQNIISFSLPAI